LLLKYRLGFFTKTFKRCNFSIFAIFSKIIKTVFGLLSLNSFTNLYAFLGPKRERLKAKTASGISFKAHSNCDTFPVLNNSSSVI
jgi:hypothetical protein